MIRPSRHCSITCIINTGTRAIILLSSYSKFIRVTTPCLTVVVVEKNIPAVRLCIQTEKDSQIKFATRNSVYDTPYTLKNCVIARPSFLLFSFLVNHFE